MMRKFGDKEAWIVWQAFVGSVTSSMWRDWKAGDADSLAKPPVAS
jgi:hypothetical protein